MDSDRDSLGYLTPIATSAIRRLQQTPHINAEQGFQQMGQADVEMVFPGKRPVMLIDMLGVLCDYQESFEIR
jgi:hypothetical protein